MIFYGLTDTGKKRDNNQDVFYTHSFDNNAGFAVVCDGMGGHNCGNVASKIASDTIVSYITQSNISNTEKCNVKDILCDAIISANAAVHSKSKSEIMCQGMGTTTVVVAVFNGECCIAHVGDSRAYILEDGGLYQLTKDHSRVQELLESGIITREEIRNHPDKNKITRAVGVNSNVDIDITELKFESGQKLLLCSDGLSNMLTDDEISEVLINNHAKQACKKLVELANIAGGTDNITVVVIE